MGRINKGVPACAVRHDPLALCITNLGAQVCFGRPAELALVALWDVQRHNMVARLHRGHPFAHRLNNAAPLVPKHDWECAFGIETAQSVGVSVAHACGQNLGRQQSHERVGCRGKIPENPNPPHAYCCARSRHFQIFKSCQLAFSRHTPNAATDASATLATQQLHFGLP